MTTTKGGDFNIYNKTKKVSISLMKLSFCMLFLKHQNESN
jgi:hypothetical protein